MVGLVPVRERASGGGPVLESGGIPGAGQEAEIVSRVQPGVMLVLGDEAEDADWGSVYITTRRVIWLSHQDATKGYSVDFLSLGVHALCRDLESYPRECIYMQIDHPDDDGHEFEDEEEEEGEEDREEGMAQGVAAGGGHPANGTRTGGEGGGGEEPMVVGEEMGNGKEAVGHSRGQPGAYLDLSRVSEVRLVPQDPSTLDALFQCLSANAALNPDPEGEREGEGDWFFDEDEVLGGVEREVGGGMLGDPAEGLERPNPMHVELQENTDQFDDAEEDDEEEGA